MGWTDLTSFTILQPEIATDRSSHARSLPGPWSVGRVAGWQHIDIIPAIGRGIWGIRTWQSYRNHNIILTGLERKAAVAGAGWQLEPRLVCPEVPPSTSLLRPERLVESTSSRGVARAGGTL